MMDMLKVVTLVAVLAAASAVAAAETAATSPSEPGKTVVSKDGDYETGMALGIVGVCLGAAGAAIGGGLGIARVGGKCVEAIARQPEAAGSMFAPMLVTAAMIEGGMFAAMLVCFVAVMRL
jgi:F-type H+-transporting ATPase subunit c